MEVLGFQPPLCVPLSLTLAIKPGDQLEEKAQIYVCAYVGGSGGLRGGGGGLKKKKEVVVDEREPQTVAVTIQIYHPFVLSPLYHPCDEINQH